MTLVSLMTQNPTTLGSWGLLVAQAIDSYDLDSKQIFQQAGVDLDEIKKTDARFPTEQMVKVWHLAVQQTQDPFIALRVVHLFKPAAHSALGMAMAASVNGYDALQRASRYSNIVSDGSISSIEEDDTQVAFVVRPRPDLEFLTHIYGMSAVLCIVYKVLRDVAGKSLAVKQVHFEQSLDSTQPFEDYFGCPVFYGADSYKIIFDKKYMFCEQAFSNAKLANTLDEWVEEYIEQNQHDKVSSQVQKYLLEHLAYGELDQPRVAKGLAMSTRLLQRKLQEEGTLYSELLDNCRMKLAVKLIKKGKLPLSEVAFMLGFSGQSNFTRAFKSWTGATPNQFRETGIQPAEVDET